MHIGERLREERDRLGMGQAEFCAAADVARKTQFNYESGERSPDADYLAAVLRLGVDVLYVLNGSRSFVPPDPLTPREAVLLDNYRRAGGTGQRTIEATAAAFAAGGEAPSKRHTSAVLGAPKSKTQVFHAPVENVTGRGGVHYHGTPKAKKPKPPSSGGG